MTQATYTQAQLLAVAGVIKWDYFRPQMIREIHQTADGAELLRLIVRDDLNGAADKIASALWCQL